MPKSKRNKIGACGGTLHDVQDVVVLAAAGGLLCRSGPTVAHRRLPPSRPARSEPDQDEEEDKGVEGGHHRARAAMRRRVSARLAAGAGAPAGAEEHRSKEQQPGVRACTQQRVHCVLVSFCAATRRSTCSGTSTCAPSTSRSCGRSSRRAAGWCAQRARCATRRRMAVTTSGQAAIITAPPRGRPLCPPTHRFVMGSTKMLAVALGKEESDELRPNLHKLAARIKGQVRRVGHPSVRRARTAGQACGGGGRTGASNAAAGAGGDHAGCFRPARLVA